MDGISGDPVDRPVPHFASGVQASKFIDPPCAILWSVGLDVYVGSLTRYHTGNWELVAQQAAKEIGLPIQVIHQNDPTDAVRDPEQIRPTVLAWRESLSVALADQLPTPLDWDEREETPYFTDKPTWDCYSDLVLWAAYDEQRQLHPPEEHIDDWSEDPAYRLSSQPDANPRYSHLYDVGLWLPCDFGFVFKTEDISGAEILVGSSLILLKQLKELNARKWQAEPGTLHQWRRDGAEHGAPLQVGARFALALFSELADEAIKHQLPMRLDW